MESKTKSDMGVKINSNPLIHKPEEMIKKWQEYLEYLYKCDQRPYDVETEDESK